jgi:hypothetical protein
MASGPRVVSAQVALTLLEVIRSQDRPEEFLQDENPTVTMPRRLGLSDVIDTQIRRYRDEARRRQRITEEEIGDLFRLVVRRPDAREVFFEAGTLLAGPLPRRRRAGRLKGRVARTLARRRVRKRLKRLFGRRVGGFGQGAFNLQGTGLIFARATPSGEACELVSGICQAILEGYDARPLLLVHDACEARGGQRCGWSLSFSEGGDVPDPGGSSERVAPA